MYGIDHVAIYANDADALKAWYADTFGFNIVSENFLSTMNGKIEILQARRDGGVLGETVSGIRHIAIQCEDFEDTVEMLKSRNVQVMYEPKTRATSKTFFFRDPEGNILQLIKWTE
jgi:catechol 2,3-dioxygenase-like lactoylglutathione lyase family enzyme